MVTIKTMESFETEIFIKSLSLPQDVARGALQTEQDCKDFYIGYYGRNRNLIDDLYDYREYKIEQSDTTVDAFIELCNKKGLKDSFEETFFQLFTSTDVALITDAIAKGRTSLVQIFEGFEKNPNKNILRNVL